jgi:hypothetical protein
MAASRTPLCHPERVGTRAVDVHVESQLEKSTAKATSLPLFSAMQGRITLSLRSLFTSLSHVSVLWDKRGCCSGPSGRHRGAR